MIFLCELKIQPCPNKCPGYIGSMPGGENFSIDHNEEIKKKLFVENQIWQCNCSLLQILGNKKLTYAMISKSDSINLHYQVIDTGYVSL